MHAMRIFKFTPKPVRSPLPASALPWQRLFPILLWWRSQTRSTISADALAALLVTCMSIPQALAYAQLAGLPPTMGLYASVLPTLVYALMGSSRTLSIGPVALLALMVAQALADLHLPNEAAVIQAALMLALLSGSMLIVMGALRLGFLTNFLSHPVVSGFMTASGILIAASQVKHLLGLSALGQPISGETLPQMLMSWGQALWTASHSAAPNWLGMFVTLAIGVGSFAMLLWMRTGLAPLLIRVHLPASIAQPCAKLAPLIVLVASGLIVWAGDLGQLGVSLVGSVPVGLPPLTWPLPALGQADGLAQNWLMEIQAWFSQFWRLWQALWLPSFLIALIGFVESISLAQTLAAKKRERVDADQELIGQGAANIAAAFTGGMPVNASMSRTLLNHASGAQTQMASILMAVCLLVVVLTCAPLLAYLPQTTLAALIAVAVLGLIDFSVLGRSWHYAKSDFLAVLVTFTMTLLAGIELGILTGLLLSIVTYLIRSAKPHIAVIGQYPGTEHYRNVERHAVQTHPHILSLRVDESLYFANARYLEEKLLALLAAQPAVTQVILNCSAVNAIDFSALESLEHMNHRLHEAGIAFHLSEVKGPVMDNLKKVGFIEQLHGSIFLTHHQAVQALRHLQLVEPLANTTPAARPS